MDKYNQKWVSTLFRKPKWAITLGQTTYYSCFKEDITPAWKAHEDTHKEQWESEGLVKFSVKYLWYQLKYGYKDNPYEKEANECLKNTLKK